MEEATFLTQVVMESGLRQCFQGVVEMNYLVGDQVRQATTHSPGGRPQYAEVSHQDNKLRQAKSGHTKSKSGVKDCRNTCHLPVRCDEQLIN